ncbi:hypothetical protein A6M27_05675 [Acidithiobacillus thiooxidans]|jgi:hypothetical protein|uniref:Uncharacterized protein n=1 Tax=Acidithiobacillus thiooxidans TaxID=930 RepID=A0A1C2IVQ9_ACITH|nr:hypothetical protein [Acidithiobacillus thiooxidans]OCX72528.1 hypothetical protein A6P07_09620 [Acidithiobacillus thiooxidans]OCX74911.1 hypothetical protein A6O24_10355 [Acidithiobacillus thiooxidans]OCX80083.1 hypothetical protein A6O26_15805 [Acidithiobacillus thiooxidans]OCX88791.1 hypothetical protein A6M27_05675 [Acidithiobacillus thiooxidans]OFC40699.1 hypothetical protein BAE47_19770 [Acidithiobacillus thiooxidans]
MSSNLITKYSDTEIRGLLYQARKGDATALATLERRACAGHVNAQRYLGVYWFRTKEPERAVACWCAAFPHGCRWSRYYYGKALYLGRGIAQNRFWALRQWRLLRGHPSSVGRLARHALYLYATEITD